MPTIDNSLKLDFSDVLIRPKRSRAISRKDIDLEKRYDFLNCQMLTYGGEPLTTNHFSGIPIIASNMDAVGTVAMAEALAKHNMMTCLHKHHSTDALVDIISRWPERVFYTLGIKDNDIEKLDYVYTKLVKNNRHPHFPINLSVDVANGYSEYFLDRVKKIRSKYPHTLIMAGNVATPEMVSELLISGAADIVKVGIGSGSVCTTRIKTGVGFPQLSAVLECSDAAHGIGGHVCSDGGCNTPGDIVKAFGAGADFVMLGGFLAGHDECEGEWVYDHIHCTEEMISKGEVKRKALKFYGMSSEEAQKKYDGGIADYKAAEGKCTTVPYKGPVANAIREIEGGLRSACAYVGANRLKDLPKCTTFIRVNRTHNTIFEES